MKRILVAFLIMCLGATTAFANVNPNQVSQSDLDKLALIVDGEFGKKIYDSLSLERVDTKITKNFIWDVKKVNGLQCAKVTNKHQLDQIYYGCALANQKLVIIRINNKWVIAGGQGGGGDDGEDDEGEGEEEDEGEDEEDDVEEDETEEDDAEEDDAEEDDAEEDDADEDDAEE